MYKSRLFHLFLLLFSAHFILLPTSTLDAVRYSSLNLKLTYREQGYISLSFGPKGGRKANDTIDIKNSKDEYKTALNIHTNTVKAKYTISISSAQKGNIALLKDKNKKIPYAFQYQQAGGNIKSANLKDKVEIRGKNPEHLEQLALIFQLKEAENPESGEYQDDITIQVEADI